jgi:aminoglycoside 2'-N-acetyltransferase I
MAQVRVRGRRSYTARELVELRGWLEDAYGDPPGSWRAQMWDDLGPGPHVVLEDPLDGSLLAHACVAWVPVTAGTTTMDAGYLEAVATRPDVRGRGYGSAVVEGAMEIIRERATIGFLGTGEFSFYERLGWTRWRGPSSVVEADGSITPTPEEDCWLMALFLPSTPPEVTVDLPVRRPRRDPEEAW